ncbi:uncharacterized protein LOC131889555 isoform X1 [Tigriopus californicus]|uniref:uncharacterized protein LOC131889555 isoform X1 n=1 Tax=Tigriopus californicus TaxID=6832 RepID=UPI0027DA5A9B|nr:uncharacterized protein LOC131889555 isoform X1 [Tigriopus californicus]
MSIIRKEIAAKCEFTIFDVVLKPKSNRISPELPLNVKFRLDHHNRHLVTSSKEYDSASFSSADGSYSLEWSPPETIGAPVTLYSNNKEDKIQNKMWTIQLIGTFPSNPGDLKEVILGKKELDLGHQYKEDCSRLGMITLLSSDSSDYECQVRLRLSVDILDDVDGDHPPKQRTIRRIPQIIVDDKKHACVLLLGTTGTGKTSTMNIYTGNNLPTGSDAHSVTCETVFCKDLVHSQGVAWIDNPGWSDTEGRSDAAVFKTLLRFLQRTESYNIQAVIWNVLPQPRMDSTLQRQAAFIDMFTVDEAKGKIWTKVIIVAKGGKQPEEDCLGAKMAAKKQFVHAEPTCLSYEFVTPEILKGTSEELRTEQLRMLTNLEIRKELETAIEDLGPDPVQVVFANQRCEDCGQTGDPRLMDDRCHKERVLGHIGQLEQRFPKAVVAASIAGSVLGAIGLGAASTVAPGAEVALAGLPMVLAPGAVCSTHRLLNSESQEEGGLCVKIHDMRWSCCRKGEKSTGCTFKCSCGLIWGNSPPCILIKHPDPNAAKAMSEYEVFKKEHTLVDINMVVSG